MKAPSTSLLFAAAVAVPLAIFAITGLFAYRQVESEALRRAERTAQVLAEHALRTLRAHELIMDAVDGRIAGMSWREITGSRAVHEFLAMLRRDVPDVNTVFVIAPSGTNGASSLRHPLAPVDVRKRSFFTAPRDGEALHVSVPDVGRLNRLPYFSLARRLSSVDGRFNGIVSVSVNPEYFEAFYAAIGETREDSVALVRADGAVLARIPDTHRVEARMPGDGPLLRHIAARVHAGAYAGRSHIDGVERLFAYRRVGSFPVYVVYGLSRSAVWSAWTRAMVAYGVICLAAIALLMAAAALVRHRARREALAGRRYAEEAARRLAAEEASRSKDAFIATMSHELRNPLSAIAASSEVLAREPLPEGRGREAVAILGRQVTHLRHLLDDLLDVARTIYGKIQLQLEPVEVLSFLREVATPHAVSSSGEAAWIRADRTRLRQMVENLLDNARKFGGREIGIFVAQDGESVRITIADDGEGLSPDLLSRLFHPFVQGEQSLDRGRGGLGLGLALVHRLAGLHGGGVSAQSEGPGKGSRFTLVLPRAAPMAPRAGEAVAGKPHPGKRVLVVEDHRDVRESLRALLELDRHHVETAATADGALEKLESFSPQLALLDIGLPGMDGYALAREIRRRTGGAGPRLIAVTGYGNEADRRRAYEAGFDGHIVKPVSSVLLQQALGEAPAQ